MRDDEKSRGPVLDSEATHDRRDALRVSLRSSITSRQPIATLSPGTGLRAIGLGWPYNSAFYAIRDARGPARKVSQRRCCGGSQGKSAQTPHRSEAMLNGTRPEEKRRNDQPL